MFLDGKLLTGCSGIQEREHIKIIQVTTYLETAIQLVTVQQPALASRCISQTQCRQMHIQIKHSLQQV